MSELCTGMPQFQRYSVVKYPASSYADAKCRRYDLVIGFEPWVLTVCPVNPNVQLYKSCVRILDPVAMEIHAE